MAEQEMEKNIERRCDYEESLRRERHRLTADDKQQLDNAERGKAAAFNFDLALDEPGPMVSKALLDRIRSFIDGTGVDPGSHWEPLLRSIVDMIDETDVAFTKVVILGQKSLRSTFRGGNRLYWLKSKVEETNQDIDTLQAWVSQTRFLVE